MLETPEEEAAIGRRLLEEVLAPMKETFVGKDEIVDLMGLCLVAGENLFLLGPPGTAKSALVQELGRRLSGSTFEYLLTRFTEPSEIFGPFDIAKLKDGVLETNTEGMLPEASLAFLDELLNANSAVLNSLLTVLNERVFRRGRETRQVPLLMTVGASNHLPEDEALRALFDRFLLRVRSDNVEGDQLAAVVARGWDREAALTSGEAAETVKTLSIEEVRRLHRHLAQVDLGPVRDDYVDLVSRLRRAGIPLSDRRAVKLQRPVAASALLCGRMKAERSDLWIFRHIWDREEQEELLRGIVNGVVEKKDEDAGAHPQADSPSSPDPETLQRDLASLQTQLEGEVDEAEKALLREQVSGLGERVGWVENDLARNQLESQVDGLWSRLDG